MNILLSFLLLLIFLINFSGIISPQFVFAVSDNVIITGTVLGCGDGAIQSGEECDGSNLNNQTCANRGYAGGVLSCSSNCTFNTLQCTSGGGGGGGYAAPVIASVIFSGRAYPKSTVTVLKDAQIAATTIAGQDANFQVTISGISAGNYIFSVYSEDSQGRRSSLLTFSVGITKGAAANISGIFIAPTIAVDKAEVKLGDNIAIFGQSVPRADITIAVSSDEEFFGKTFADQNGAYLYNFDTVQLEIGQHFTKSKAAKDGAISSFSKAVNFTVSTKTALAQPKKCEKADLNCDSRINLVDFSIAAYWYKRALSSDFKKLEMERLNGDGKVNLIDFSIMAYYWTG